MGRKITFNLLRDSAHIEKPFSAPQPITEYLVGNMFYGVLVGKL